MGDVGSYEAQIVDYIQDMLRKISQRPSFLGRTQLHNRS